MIRLLVAAAAFVAAAPAAARTVDYTLPPEEVARLSQALDVPLRPLPTPGRHDILFEAAPGVDHEVLRLGIACSAYGVDNPVTPLLRSQFAAFDRDGTLGEAGAGAERIHVRIAAARTMSRCFAIAETDSRCVTTVSLSGEAVVEGAGTPERRVPLSVTVERTTRVGTCEITRGIGLVSRLAGVTLVHQLAEAANAR